jgi:protein-S-isoprenylcysteine O-methyltransferase Ste14
VRNDRVFQLVIDYAERVFLTLLYVPFAMAFSSKLDGEPWAIGILLIEALVLILVIFRRHGWTNPAPWPALLAVTGTALPLLFRPGGEMLLAIGGPMMAGAALWCLLAKAFMNRRWGVLAANRGVQTKGPYALMRHPVYAGYLVAHIGLLLTWPTAWNFALFVVTWAAQIARLLEEERFLSLDPVYVAYRRRVRFRLVPGLF